MKDCFEVRYNLEKMTNECATDVPGALFASWSLAKSNHRRSGEIKNLRIKEIIL